MRVPCATAFGIVQHDSTSACSAACVPGIDNGGSTMVECLRSLSWHFVATPACTVRGYFDALWLIGGDHMPDAWTTIRSTAPHCTAPHCSQTSVSWHTAHAAQGGLAHLRQYFGLHLWLARGHRGFRAPRPAAAWHDAAAGIVAGVGPAAGMRHIWRRGRPPRPAAATGAFTRCKVISVRR